MRSPGRLIGLIATLVVPALLQAQTYPSGADPRNNLKPGRLDAGTAASNTRNIPSELVLRLVTIKPLQSVFDMIRLGGPAR